MITSTVHAEWMRRRRIFEAAPLAAVLLSLAAVPVLAQAGAVLPGGNSKQPVNIQATKLDYFDKEQKLIYTGNVVAVQGTSKLKCSVLVIYLPPKVEGQSSTPSSSSQVQHMDATGPVTMISKDQVGTGDNGSYDKAKDQVILIGNVTLTQGPNVTRGDRLEYALKSGEAHVTGRNVQSMIIPDNGPSSGPSSGPSEPAAKKPGPGKRGSRS